jgi:hypothetical protein
VGDEEVTVVEGRVRAWAAVGAASGQTEPCGLSVGLVWASTLGGGWSASLASGG